MAAGLLAISAYTPARDRQGRLVPGARMDVYANRTTTRAAVYADAALTTPLTNPVLANASGQFPAVWADGGTTETPILYSLAYSASDGTTIGNPSTFDDAQPGVSLDLVDGEAKLDKAQNLSDVPSAAQARENLAAVFAKAPNTSKFLEGLGAASATVNRLGDRVFMGGAVDNDARFPNVAKDWFTAFETANGRPNGLIVSAQAAVLTNDSPGARVGLVVAARTSTVSADTGYVQAFHFSIVQDRTSSLIPATGGYAEAWRMSDACGAVQALELDTINKGGYNPITPFAQSAKQDVALQLASGGEFSVFDSSAAVNVRNNGAKFGAALIVGHNAIVGSDGATGTGHAIQLAIRHQISWYNAFGDNTAGVFGGVTSMAFRTRLAFIDSGAAFLGPTDNVLARFDPVANVANYFSFQAGTAGGAVSVAAMGNDANVAIRLVPKGTGLVSLAGQALSEGRFTVQGPLRLGARTNTSDVPIVGYLTVESSDGGTQKLAIIN